MPAEIPLQQLLIGQRVRVGDKARGEHWPDVGHWVAEVCYDPAEGRILYGVSANWPPANRADVQEGFYASDLMLWSD